jgi:hypothetical protein
MKYVTTMTLLSLTVLSFLILSNGCAYKDRKDSFVDETVGVLQDKGQGVCLNVRSGRMWQIERGGKFSSLQEAEQYAGMMIGVCLQKQSYLTFIIYFSGRIMVIAP